ncbi:MAG: glycosyltransferase family 39 protein [Chloroflexi bacterium]|nr:glycosyltransferase family 39 protein [Chloroflexota bacterium]
MWPFVGSILDDKEDHPFQVFITGLALSVGLLATVLYGLGVTPARLVTPFVVLSVIIIGWAVGLLVNPGWLSPQDWLTYWRETLHSWRQRPFEALLLLAVLSVLAVGLIHATYYPFIGDDVLTRYGLQAQAIYQERRIPSSVWGYPPLAPLTFVSTWFAAGIPNEQLAKLFPIIMGAGTLGATFLLGKQIVHERAGLLAAALVAVTPLFANNLVIAYVDIPTAFPLTMAIYYMLRWWDSGDVTHALLAGTLTGIGLITKQSALTWLPSLLLVPVLWAWTHRDTFIIDRWRRLGNGLFGALFPVIAIAAPWYLRNIEIGGWENTLPVAGLFHLLDQQTGLLGLLPPLAWVQDFGPLTAILYTAGWGLGIWAALQQARKLPHADQRDLPADLILAGFALPYWLAWWSNFSFDARFLLQILPIMAIWTARPLSNWIEQVAAIEAHALLRTTAALLVVGVVALFGARGILGGPYRAIVAPFASYEDRLRHAKGDMIALVQYTRSNLDPDTDRLMLMDERMAYYLTEFDVAVMYPLTLADLAETDYLIHASGVFTIYSDRLGYDESEFYQHIWNPEVFETVYETNGIHVMRVLRSSPPDAADRDEP